MPDEGGEQKWRDIPWGERRWVLYSLVCRLQPHAHALSLHETIEQEYAKDVSIGWLYSTLERFEQEGYLRAESKRPESDEEFAARGYRNRLYWYPTGKPRRLKTAKKAVFGGIFQPQTA